MQEKERVKKSLRYSIVEGSFWSIMAGFGLDFLQPFAVLLKATTLQLGLLSTLPQLLGSLSQLLDEWLMTLFKSKKKFVLFFVAVQALLWLPIAFIPYMNHGSQLVWILIALAVLHFTCGLIVSPIWSAWIGDLVEINSRGSYFGIRNKVSGYVYFFSYLAAGLILYYLKLLYNSPFIAFTILFLIAMFARIVSYTYLTKHYEPHNHFKVKKISFIQFLKETKQTNFGWLTAYLSLTNFSVYVAAPYFAAYLLNDLHLNYLQFVIVIAASLLAKNVSMPIWGKFGDRYGSLKVLTLAGFMVPAVAFALILSKSWVYLIFAQIFSGIAWAGFDLASFTFILDSTKPEKRICYISYYNVIQGVFVFIGSMIGVWLVKFGFLAWSGYAFLFLISGVLRYAVAFLLLGKLKEVRPVTKIKYSHLFVKVITSLPTVSSISHIGHINGFLNSKK